MSLTLDRLNDERPEVVFLKRVNVVDNFDYEMDAQYTGEGATLKITFTCQPWGAKVLKEDDEGRLLIEITYDTEGEGLGARDLVMVRGFTPGYND